MSLLLAAPESGGGGEAGRAGEEGPPGAGVPGSHTACLPAAPGRGTCGVKAWAQWAGVCHRVGAPLRLDLLCSPPPATSEELEAGARGCPKSRKGGGKTPSTLGGQLEKGVKGAGQVERAGGDGGSRGFSEELRGRWDPGQSRGLSSENTAAARREEGPHPGMSETAGPGGPGPSGPAGAKPPLLGRGRVGGPGL